MSYEDLIAARAMRQEKEAAKEAARERKMKKSKRNIMNDEKFENTAFHVITAALRDGTEAEPGVFSAEAQTDEDVKRSTFPGSGGSNVLM